MTERRTGVSAALERVYGPVEPEYRWTTIHRWDQGGDDPLDDILVFAHETPVPHWHYVGVGLSSTPTGRALTEDDEDDGRGWNFELTARLAKEDGDEHAHPPAFMANVLQNLARYVATTGNALGPGHTIDLHGPIRIGATTPVEHVMFVLDSAVDPSDDDAVQFLQIVGLTADEVAAKKSWTADGFAGLFAEHHPGLVTRLDRTSVLAEPGVLAAVEEGRARDGSSTGGLSVDALTVEVPRPLLSRVLRRAGEAVVTLPAGAVDALVLLLPLRIRFGQTFTLTGPETSLTFAPGTGRMHEHAPRSWALHVTHEQAVALATSLRPMAGSYREASLAGLRFDVVQTVVRDQAGAEIGRIG